MAITAEVGTSHVIEQHFDHVHDALQRVPPETVDAIVDLVVDTYRNDQNVFILGNGGSASTATHFACDLSKATIAAGKRRLRVSSLTDNVAVLTAWANDTSFDRVFAEQLLSLLRPGDAVIAVSASGNSPNVLAAMEVAMATGARTAALVGFSGGRLKDIAGVVVHVPVDDYGVVEDCHLVVEHAVTDAVRVRLLAFDADGAGSC